MSYLLQERNESCIKYPSINQHPINHFKHLFFTNGNGIEFEDGNPVKYVDFGRCIPWTCYYNESLTFNYMKDHYVEYELERSVDQTLKLIHQQDSYENVYNEQIAELDNILELTEEQITDREFWIIQLFSFDVENFFPYLSLSDGYFKLQEIDENTEKLLLTVAIAIVEAYIHVFRFIKYNKDVILQFKSILSFKWNDKDIERCYVRSMDSLNMLTKELKRLKSI